MHAYAWRVRPMGGLMQWDRELARRAARRTADAASAADTATWRPSVDVINGEDRIVLLADLPGVGRDDIEIELSGETLTLRGERKFPEGADRGSYVRSERPFGRFSRTFTVESPIVAENITATYRDGSVEIVLPKAEAAKPMKVQVTEG